MKTHVLVLGGNGFIGSAVVNELRRSGLEVLVGTRAKGRCLRVGERRISFHAADDQDWDQAIKGCQIVINTVGILRQRWKESYEQVHHEAVAKLADACAKKNVRLVHISVLGLQYDVRSRFLLSKARGEQALLNSGADWVIVRPSLLEGKDGFGARWFRRIANWPIHMTPADAKGRIAPLHVRELARLVCRIAYKEGRTRIYELGGDRQFSFEDYLSHLARSKPLLRIKVPGIVVRLLSHLLDLLHLTPLSYGHYELMRNDNLPTNTSAPARVGASNEGFLNRTETLYGNGR